LSLLARYNSPDNNKRLTWMMIGSNSNSLNLSTLSALFVAHFQMAPVTAAISSWNKITWLPPNQKLLRNRQCNICVTDLGAGIDPGIALTPFPPSSILNERDSNQQPFDCLLIIWPDWRTNADADRFTDLDKLKIPDWKITMKTKLGLKRPY